MKKGFVIMMCVLMSAVLLTGCMNTDGRTLGSTKVPENTATAQPAENTASPTTSAQPYDWVANAQAVQDKINQLSEIQKSTVVVNGNTALVGVTFTGSYVGELTQRIHDMVAAEVQSVDPSIEKVAVTAEKEDVKKIEELADKIKSGTPAADLEQEIDSIARNVTTMS